MQYQASDVWRFLNGFQRVALGTNLERSEERLRMRLGARPPPPTEASWASQARWQADMMSAFDSLPAIPDRYVTFMAICMREGSWKGERFPTWNRIAEWWDMTPSEIDAIVNRSVGKMVDHLNGVATDVS